MSEELERKIAEWQKSLEDAHIIERTAETLIEPGTRVRVVIDYDTREVYTDGQYVSYMVHKHETGVIDHYLDLCYDDEDDDDQPIRVESYDTALRMDRDGKIVWVHADYLSEHIDLTPDEVAEVRQILGVE